MELYVSMKVGLHVGRLHLPTRNIGMPLITGAKKANAVNVMMAVVRIATLCIMITLIGVSDSCLRSTVTRDYITVEGG